MELSIEKKAQLNEYLNGITEIFFNVKETYLIAVRLTRPINDSEFEYIKTDEYLNMITYTMWVFAQIEISKLVTDSKSQHYSIIRLLKKFEAGGYFETDLIKPEIIVKWKSDFKKLEKTIKDITTMRDKSFAHTDKDRKDFIEKIKITISDFEEVLGLVAIIIKHIKMAIFQNAYLLVTPLEEKPNLILARLSYALEMEQQDEKLYKKLRGIPC